MGKTWDDMKHHVNCTMRHKETLAPSSQQLRPNSPTSTHSASSCRTSANNAGSRRPTVVAGLCDDVFLEDRPQIVIRLQQLEAMGLQNTQLEEENEKLQFELLDLEREI